MQSFDSISSFTFSYEQSQYKTLYEFYLWLDTNDDGEYDTFAHAPLGLCGVDSSNERARTIDVLHGSRCGIATNGFGGEHFYGTWAEFLADFGDAKVPATGPSIHFNLQHENLQSNPETATARIYDVENSSTEETGTTPDTTDQYAGVYLTNGSLSGKTFEDITSLGFSYNGDVSGGSPRFSIPIAGGGYVLIDAASCGDGTKVAPLTDPTCAVSGYTGGRSFYHSSWADFLAAENLVVGDQAPFIIADQPGTVTVSGIAIGNTAKGRR